MRTLVDIPEGDIEVLNALSASRRVSRAALVRQAIKAFIDLNRNRPVSMMDGLGIWKDYEIDGDEYQREIRAEWDRD